MAGLEVDTSSYPKPQMPVSPLDTAHKLGSLDQQQQQLQSGALTIDKQKLDLLNQRFGEMAKTFTALATDPSLNQDKIIKHVQDQLKLGYITPDIASKTIGMIPPTQNLPPQEATKVLKKWAETQLTHASTVMEAITQQYGNPQTLNVGNAQQPVSVSPTKGIRSTGLPIATQQGPDTNEYDPNTGQPRYRGVQPPVAAPGMATAPPSVPGTPAANVAPRPSLPVAQPPAPDTFNQRTDAAFPRSGGGLSAPPPGFAEGLKQRTDDQNIATAKMQAVKPAIQALKLMPGLSTGPGTAQFTDLVAAAKAWGIVDTKAENDPTVLRQELEKKLAQYVGNSPIGQRSDAALAISEAGSPNPKKQILPALMQLTRDAIVLDRVEAARPNAFAGKNYSEYGTHRSQFPQSIDERAFGLDLMEKDKAQKLLKDMRFKYEKNPKNSEVLKFYNSLGIAEKQGFFHPDDFK